jgi:hypothetical protein
MASAMTRGARRRPAECRRRGRITCDLPSVCHPLAAGPDLGLLWRGKVRDLSAGGLGLVLGRRFEVGTVVFVEAGGTEARHPERLIARVAHTRALAEERWLVGCAFLSRLGAEKLEAVLSCTRPEPAGRGRETSPSLKCLSARLAVEGLSSLTSGRKGRSARSILRNVLFEGAASRAGQPSLLVRQADLRGPWPLPGGETLLVQLHDLGGDAAAARLKVRECCQRGPLWVISYEFTGTPSAEVLHMFGQQSPPESGL